MLTATPAAAAVYAPGGRLLGPGDRLRFDDLAETLVHIGEAGPATMRDGHLAEALVSHMAASGGHVTADDLARVPRHRPDARCGSPTGTPRCSPTRRPPRAGALIAAALAEMEEGGAPASAAAHYLAVTRAGVAANAMRDDAVPRRSARGGLHGAPLGAAHGGRARARRGRDPQAGRIDDPRQRDRRRRGHGEPLQLQRVRIGRGAARDGHPPQQHDGRRGPQPGRLRPPGARHADDLDDGAEPAAARRRAGHRARRRRVQPPALGHPPDRRQHGRRRLSDAGDAVRRPRVHPEGVGVDVEGGVPQDAVDALAHRRPPAAPLGRAQPVLRRRQRRRPGRPVGSRAPGIRAAVAPPRRSREPER